MQRFLFVLSFFFVLGAGCTSTPPAQRSSSTQNTQTDSSPSPSVSNQTARTFPGKLSDDEITNKQVRITTNKGDIVIAFYPDTAPLAVSNFLTLASSGFYDGVIFHRVISGFMIQGGDPTGTGTGGPGYSFPDELGDDRTYTRGTVAMANAGKNTNGSQFFIMHKDYPLQHDYTIFGSVTSGMDVVDAIATTPTNKANDRPLADVVMERMSVEEAK